MTTPGSTGHSLVCALVALLVPISASAQAADVTLTYSTTPLTRNADLMLTVAILSTAASDEGLEALSTSLARAPRPGGRLVRAAKLVLLDFPVVGYFAALNHEWGHQVGADEYGVRSRLYFEGSPWSSKPFGLAALSPVPEAPPAAAVIHGGGLEASRHLKDLSEWRMTRVDRISIGQTLATVVASLDTPSYAFDDLSRDKFQHAPHGDVLTVVRDLAVRRSIHTGVELDRLRSDVRSRSALNLLDAALWTETYGLVRDYVWNGEKSVRVRWLHIGAAALLPSARYELSPFGPEYYVGSYFKVLGTRARAYGRWTERIGSERLTGGGGSFLLPDLAGVAKGARRAVPATITIDAWSHTVDGFGMHASLGADVEDWPSRRAALTMAIGAKSTGHLIGYSLDSGAYVTIGMSLRVW